MTDQLAFTHLFALITQYKRIWRINLHILSGIHITGKKCLVRLGEHRNYLVYIYWKVEARDSEHVALYVCSQPARCRW
jgi:hypothetical protein